MPQAGPRATARYSSAMAAAPAKTARSRASLATWLSGVSLLALLPMLLFSVVVTRQLIGEQQTQALDELNRRATLAAVALGNELKSVFVELDAIAQTDSMLRGDSEALHALAVRIVAADRRLASVALSNAAGELLWSTTHGHGTPLPRSNAQAFQASIFERGERGVSPLFVGAIVKRPVVGVAIPVHLGEKGRFALRATMDPDAIGQTLNEQGWPTDWTASVIDQNRVIVARSRDSATFVGQPASPTLQAGLNSSQANFRALTKDGIPVTVSAVAVPGTGWTVVVGSPVAALNAQVRDTTLRLLVAGALCAALGVVGAVLLARKLGRQLRQVVDAHVRSDGGTSSVHVGIREVAELAAELKNARGAAALSEYALQLARQQAMLTLTERSEMLDVLAHEVRQPLNNASAALQAVGATLERRGERAVDDPLRRAEAVLSDVQASIDNTLAVATLLVTGERAHGEDTDIDTLIAVVMADLPAAEAGRVIIERATHTRTLIMDASLMRLALRNLLSNALRYSPRSEPVTVRLTDSDAPLALLIDVIDHGPGIAPDLLGQIFDRGGRRPQGAGARRKGLGLYIVRRVMEVHGGKVSLERNDRDGVTMRLMITQGAED